MAGEMSLFEERLRKRRGEVTIEETRSRQDESFIKKIKKKVQCRTGCAVLALEAQRREVAHDEANETDDDAVSTMVAEIQQLENREDGETAEGEMSSMQVDENENQNEGVKDIAAESEDKQDVESGDTHAVSETILEENQVTGQEVGGVIQEEEHDQENQAEIDTINQENHAVDNREVIVIADEDSQADNEEVNGIYHVENQNNEGVIEARELIEVDDQKNKVDEENKVETELPENQYLYAGTDDWPTTWNYEEQLVWGLGIGSSPKPDIEYICGIGWVKKNLIH